MTAMKIGMEGVLGLIIFGALSCYGNPIRLMPRLYLFQKKALLFAGFLSFLLIPNQFLYDYTPWLTSIL